MSLALHWSRPPRCAEYPARVPVAWLRARGAEPNWLSSSMLVSVCVDVRHSCFAERRVIRTPAREDADEHGPSTRERPNTT